MSTLVGSNFSDRFTIATSDDIDLSIIGNRDEDASNGIATNTLVGADRENHWSITSAGGGMLNEKVQFQDIDSLVGGTNLDQFVLSGRSEEHTSELQSRGHLVRRLLLEKKKKTE